MIISLLAFSQFSFASPFNYSIACSVEDKVVEAQFTEDQASVPFTVRNSKGIQLGQGVFTDPAFVTDDDFLNSAIFGLVSDTSVIAASIPGAKKADLASGTYEAKADLFVEYGNDFIDASTVDCVITIK